MIDDAMEIIIMILPALLLVAAGFLIGVVAEKITFHKVRKIALGARWEGGEIIIAAIHGTVKFWCVVAGLYAAMETAHFNDHLYTFLQKSLLVLVLASVTMALAKVAAGFVRLYSKRAEGVLPSISIFSNITKLSIYLVGLLVILESLGISIAPLLTALGVGGLAVALALQDTLANLFAGLHVLVSKQVKQGHYIKLSTGEEGYVTDITWRNTTLRALANNMIVIPNAKMASAVITNYDLPVKEVSLVLPVTVSYASDLAKVEAVTLAAAKEVGQETGAGGSGSEPLIRYQSLGDSGIEFNVVLPAGEFADQYLLKHALIRKLYQRYREEGIELPYPTRTIYVQEEKSDLSKK
jgi:small-conductance mechanosensitive channel